jgi:hypothetical protein
MPKTNCELKRTSLTCEKPRASIILNNETLDIHIRKGQKQGSQLLPFPSCTVLDVLANAIGQGKKLKI